jgi:tRNA pseudouridine55 synthase
MRPELNGIIVLDKPAQITSAKAVAEVKRSLGAAKVGHTGTLDPFATGVLLCCVNQATRLARFFLHGDKRYEALMRLGIATDTQDATGQEVGRAPVPELTEAQLRSVFERFVGPQWQQPPIYAALKHQGTPLYKLARQGRPVQKPPRPVTITALRIVHIALPEVRFEVSCSAGTYVRTLCADIGATLGCGGHLAELRRTACGGFTIDQAVGLETLRGLPDAQARLALLVSMERVLGHLPTFQADEQVLFRVAHGQALTPAQLPEASIQGGARPDGPFKVVDANGRLRAVVERAPDGGTYNYCCVFS